MTQWKEGSAKGQNSFGNGCICSSTQERPPLEAGTNHFQRNTIKTAETQLTFAEPFVPREMAFRRGLDKFVEERSISDHYLS